MAFLNQFFSSSACGSAAVIFVNGLHYDPITLSQPVARRSTSFHGEVAAIRLALEYVANIPSPSYNSVMIHSDCQAAIDTILNNRGVHTELITSIYDAIKVLNTKDIMIELCWIPGHAGISANETADIEAKRAAAVAGTWNDRDHPTCVTVRDVQRTLKSQLLTIWQRQWDTQLEGRFTYTLFPTVKLRTLHKFHGNVLRAAEVRLNRLQSGNTPGGRSH